MSETAWPPGRFVQTNVPFMQRDATQSYSRQR